MFITADTEPANSSPMSSATAQDTPTVSSSPNTARAKKPTPISGSVWLIASMIIAPAITKPTMATRRRAIFRLPVRLSTSSDTQPPATSPATPAISGREA